MSYLKHPPGAARGRRRVDHVDSRAESSGANTPDPMLPQEAESAAADVSKIDKTETLDVVGDLCAEDSYTNSNNFKDELGKDDVQQQSAFYASSVKERRRTLSLTKKENVWKFFHDDNSAMSWEMDEVLCL